VVPVRLLPREDGRDKTMMLDGDGRLRHYHFVIRDGDRIEHEDGAVLPDDEAARAHAVRIICVIQADEASRGSYTMEVMRDGSRVWCIPFAISYPPN